MITILSRAQTTKATEMPFGFWALVGPRNHVLHGIPDPNMRRGKLRRKGAAHC